MIDFLLHFDRHLLEFVRVYGTWVYGILFVIVFSETGLVVAPFLPGDSLLFATGALCATGALNTPATWALMVLAAFAGNTVNYSIGRFIGPRVFTSTGQGFRLLNREYLDRAHGFFETYGGKAVILSRFMPILRTFIPFVAGAARMSRAVFVLNNVIGATAWVTICLGAGWLFGNVPIIRNNFSLVTIGIVLVSVLPMVIEFINHRRRQP